MERIALTKHLDREEVKSILGINSDQLERLCRSVQFPLPIIDDGENPLWDINRIEDFFRKMVKMKARGMVVPDVFYRFEDVDEADLVWWPKVQKVKRVKLRRKDRTDEYFSHVVEGNKRRKVPPLPQPL